MKRAQVFKKTLLSVAVVTALGGTFGLTYADDADPVESEADQDKLNQAGQDVETAKGESETLKKAGSTATPDQLAADENKVTEAQVKLAPTEEELSEKRADHVSKTLEALNTQAKSEPVYRAELRPDVVSQSAVVSASKALDGASVGANVALVKGDDESPEDFDKRVAAVVKNINELKNADDIKPLFMTEEPVEGQESKVWVPAASATIRNVDLTNDTVRGRLFGKIKNATKLGNDQGSVVELSNANELVFKNEQLTLEGVHNTFDDNSVIADVSSSVDNKTDPAGSYVLKGDGSLYHKDLGKKRPLKSVTVEGQQLKVENTVSAQYVTVGAGGSISGFSVEDELDKKSEALKKIEKAGYARIEAAKPDDSLVKDKEGKVIGRQISNANIVSDEVQRGDLVGYDVIHYAGKEFYSHEITGEEVTFEKGDVIFSEGDEGVTAGTLTVAEGAVVKAVKEEVDPKDKDKKVARDVPVSVKGMEIKRQKQVSTDGGAKWTNVGGEEVTLERVHTINGTVFGNYEDVDSLIVNGALITDGVGKKDQPLNKLTLGKSGKLTRFSNQSAPVYTSSEVEYVISAGQELVHDVDGFKSFKLDGGVHGGDLTSSPAASDAKTNKEAFQGSTITLTSGTLQGGTLKSDNTIVIDGDIVIKPQVTTLSAFDSEGKAQTTVLSPSILDGDVLLTAKARPVIHKTYRVDAGDNKTKLATPAQWGKNVTMEKGAELPVSLDLSESAEDSAVAFVSVGETLTVNDNVVRATVDVSSDYEVTRDLYQKAAENKGKDFAIVDAGDIKGKFGEPVSSSKLLKAKGVDTDTEAEGRKGYGVNLAFNGEVVNELRKEYGLSDQQAVAVDYLESVALTTTDNKAGKEIHGRVQAAIANDSVQQFANENTQNNVVNGGLAQSALTVHREVNENISRRLDRSRTGVSSGDMFESQGFWGQYFYSDGSLDNKGGVPGFESKINGITIGVDADLNPDLTAGVAFSYAKGKLNTKGVSGETKSDTYMGSLYGGRNNGPYFLDGMLSYAGSRNDLARDKSKADSVKGSMWGARAVGGYMHQIQQWTLQPQAEFNYSSFKLDEFTETGDVASQRVKVDDYSVMELGAGLKVFGEFDAGRGTIKPEASLMAYHDFKDDKPAGSYRAIVAPADASWRSLVGGNREQNRYALGLGGTYAMDNNLSLGLNYDYNWSGDFKAHGFMARISYEF